MIKIMFLCDWGESSGDILSRYSNQTPECTGVWKGMKGTPNKNEADVFVVLEGLEEGVGVDFDRTLFIKREPNFIKKHDIQNYKYTLDWADANCGITWWLSKTYDELLAMDYPEKPLLASCVASSKHKHRNQFIQSLYQKKRFSLRRDSVEIDLYGRGHDQKLYGERYKGSIEGAGNCKLPGLESYKYTLVMENSQQHNYWTEKLADAYLAWCIPIYWGCPNVDDYFDKKSFYSISLDDSACHIKEIINQPIDHVMIDCLKTARENILNEFNIWEVIWKKIQTEIL
jgi:hypothetical protein